MTISKQTLSELLREQGVDDAYLRAQNYQLPTVEWMLEVLGPEIRSDIRKKRLEDFEIDANSCFVDSLRAKHIAYDMHAADPDRAPETSIAVAQYDFILPDGGGHAINLFLPPDEPLTILFFDPQTQGLTLPNRKPFTPVFADF